MIPKLTVRGTHLLWINNVCQDILKIGNWFLIQTQDSTQR